ncbi:MAG: hypothetical protein IPN16_09945 [Gemmatimonadetes bacterium]|nr:hypothetical protein [Gemmatimonadota bacterium]
MRTVVGVVTAGTFTRTVARPASSRALTRKLPSTAIAMVVAWNGCHASRRTVCRSPPSSRVSICSACALTVGCIDTV